jgi:uncharacterized RDD family membrane protein YckC
MTREFTGYARLRSRYGAFLIDVLFCLVLWFMGALMVGSVGLEFNRWNGIALLAAYFGLLPATPLQATPGKRAFNIKITDLEGKPVTVTRSMARFVASVPSLGFLGLGFVVAAWTRRRQAAHDIAARTLVLEVNAANRARLPGFRGGPGSRRPGRGLFRGGGIRERRDLPRHPEARGVHARQCRQRAACAATSFFLGAEQVMAQVCVEQADSRPVL